MDVPDEVRELIDQLQSPELTEEDIIQKIEDFELISFEIDIE